MKKNLRLFLMFLIFITGTSGIFAQRTVTGTVLDDQKQPVIGANVVIKGTTNGTMTDVNGKYSLNVPSPSSIITFSFIGYVSQDVIAGNSSVIDAVMQTEATALTEVVVVGYGTQKKTSLTGSVSTVKGESLTAYPVPNAAVALQGKIAGVTITSVDGRPDASVTIRVRGGGSITSSNDPLFLVDGFPVSNINDIPATQIESINVLKDASSSAIYGARGANGVVLITTKSAKIGKLTITYDGNYQIKQPTRFLGVLNPYDFVNLQWQYGTLFSIGDAWAMAYGLGTTYSALNPGGIDSYKTAAVRDLTREAIKTAYSQNNTISISGGDEKTKYRLSFDKVDDGGIRIGSSQERSNVLAKLSQKITKGLVLDLDMYYRNNVVYSSGTSETSLINYTPVTPLGDISGANTQLGMYEGSVRPQFDPINSMKDTYSKSISQVYRGGAALTWTVFKGLTLKSEYSFSQGYSAGYSWTGPVAKNTVGVYGGDASMSKGNSHSYLITNTANYVVKFNSLDHSLELMAGQEASNSESESSSFSGTKYPVSFNYTKAFAMMNQFGNQTEIKISNSYATPSRMLSYFGRVNYGFKDRYLLTATLRTDGSSNFAPAHRWAIFPAASVAWRISEEAFLKQVAVISNLKLRLAYGTAGNDRISSGLWKSEWSASSGGYSYQNVTNNYYVPSSTMMTNPDLKWESTITRNIGLDFGLFKNRLYGTIDAYINSTKDLLMIVQIPAYTGYTTQEQNAGETQNKGIELTLGGDIVKTKDLRISADFNISFNRNKVVALAEGMDYYYYGSGGVNMRPQGTNYALIVGKPVGLFRGFVYDGYYTTADFDYNSTTHAYTLKADIANSSTIQGTTPGITGCYPGMLKLKKLASVQSATTINDVDDCTIIGNPNPKHTGGFNINAAYKGIDMLLAFNWSYGNDIYNADRSAMRYGAKNPFHNFTDAVANWYKIFDIDASGNLVRIYDPAALDALNVNTTTYYPFQELEVINTSIIEDGSFLRLNNVTLGYTLPTSFTKRIAIQRLRVYTTINNALLWTNYTGLDPEVSTGNVSGGYPYPGMDSGAYPRARTFTFGVNVSF
jgi:TonB-dependent starch-binding outer membrane protein SusC